HPPPLPGGRHSGWSCRATATGRTAATSAPYRWEARSPESWAPVWSAGTKNSPTKPSKGGTVSTTPPEARELCSRTHASAAALIKDGHMVGLVEEERLNGDKHTRAYPRQAIEYLLDRAGLAAADVIALAYNFDPHQYRTGVPSSLSYLPRATT